MRYLVVLFLLSSATTIASTAALGCGDDPGGSELPYAYPIDATPDGVIETAADADVNRH